MKQKKRMTLQELIEKSAKKGISQKDIYSEKYSHSISHGKATDNDEDLIDKFHVKTGYYSLRTKVLKNPWIKYRPASEATKWLFREVFKDPSTYKYNRMIMGQGQMFIFEYFNPKYKDTSVLPYFDKHPLVISLGPVVTNLGVRNIGFNLHLLPPKIRIIVMCAIFEMSKKMYRYQIFLKQEKPVLIKYQSIVKGLKRFGVKFCVRMYIPSRMRQIVKFPYKDWHKAIFIPSRAYYGIRAAKLIDEWKKFCRKEGMSISPNIDWKTNI
ncbi:hypothetical protein M0Q97_08105 [Candidatus Dojkabacteria bacterium]|jgi:hypothetical protein|nr:hypothetical protein [Candidatus Dojkabacteria bacterium]